MSTASLIAVFCASLALTVIASIVLSRRIGQVGAWLGLSQALLGLVAALGSDAPEISSAVTALRSGDHDLGLGIVLGSNIFNLASLLGLSAVISGRLKLRRRTLVLNSAVALAILAITTAQLCGALPSLWAAVGIAAVMVPYVVLLAVSPERFSALLASLGIGPGVAAAKTEQESDAKRDETPPMPSYADMLGIVPALVSIVLGSIGMVHSAGSLGKQMGVAGAITGTFVLALLTGIPNIVTSTQLARKGRGSAVASEGLNSNSLNLIVGASLPALLLGAGPLSSPAFFSLMWLCGMTVAALILCSLRGGLGRTGGWLLIAAYAAFVLVYLYRF